MNNDVPLAEMHGKETMMCLAVVCKRQLNMRIL